MILLIPVFEEFILFHSGCTFPSESTGVGGASLTTSSPACVVVSVVTVAEMRSLCGLAFNRSDKKAHPKGIFAFFFNGNASV